MLRIVSIAKHQAGDGQTMFEGLKFYRLAIKKYFLSQCRLEVDGVQFFHDTLGSAAIAIGIGHVGKAIPEARSGDR